MKNLKIGKKLFVVFSSLFAITLALGVFSILGLFQMTEQFTTFHERPYVVTTEAMNMRRVIAGAERAILLSCSAMDPKAIQQAIDQANGFMNDLNNGIIVLKENFTGEKALLDDFKTYIDSTVQTKEQLFALSLKDKNTEAFQLYAKEYLPLMDNARIKLENIGAIADADALKFYQNAMNVEKITLGIIIGLLAISLTTIILYCIWITRLLTRPIKELEYMATQMVDGNLDVSISYQSKDELGSFAEKMGSFAEHLRAIIGDQNNLLSEIAAGNLNIRTKAAKNYVGDFEAMLLSLRKIVIDLTATITQISQASEQVSSNSEQVSFGAQALSQGAIEQASSIQELSATISEISSRVKETSQNAQQANTEAGITGNEVESCNQKMQELNNAMNEIAQRSIEIGNIINTIEDIALQTNILSLNAAIEAARAGVAGTGFAVVADGVRVLASKSVAAAKDTTTLIESSLQSIENGTRLMNETADSLQNVVKCTHEFTVTIDKISVAAKEQASSIEQVTMGIDQIACVVQTTSATAQESAASSEELNSQAQMLNNLVKHFELRIED